MILLAASLLSTIGIAFKIVIVVGIVRKLLHLFYFDHFSIDGERSLLSAGLDFSIVIINFVSQGMFVMNVYDNVNSSCINLNRLNRLATCTQCVPIFQITVIKI
jgi:heme/copper-type cytochrome/quinol oxidase subunit 4